MIDKNQRGRSQLLEGNVNNSHESNSLKLKKHSSVLNNLGAREKLMIDDSK